MKQRFGSMGAVVGVCVIKLGFDGTTSLKEKRSRMNSIKDRVRRRFEIAVAETGELDSMRKAELTFCAVSSEEALVCSLLEKAVEFVEDMGTSRIIDTRIELVHM